MLQALKRDKAFYRYLVSLTAPIALQNLITRIQEKKLAAAERSAA